jgi:hypothetical protein
MSRLFGCDGGGVVVVWDAPRRSWRSTRAAPTARRSPSSSSSSARVGALQDLVLQVALL